MSGSFIFQGRIYAVRMGEIVRVYNSYLYGDTITLGTERYEVLLQNRRGFAQILIHVHLLTLRFLTVKLVCILPSAANRFL